MNPLTDRQRHVLEFVTDCIRISGRPPTIREVCTHFGWSSMTAAKDHLKAIERKGYIVMGHRSARNIRLTTQAHAASAHRCPYCGQGLPP